MTSRTPCDYGRHRLKFSHNVLLLHIGLSESVQHQNVEEQTWSACTQNDHRSGNIVSLERVYLQYFVIGHCVMRELNDETMNAQNSLRHTILQRMTSYCITAFGLSSNPLSQNSGMDYKHYNLNWIIIKDL